MDKDVIGSDFQIKEKESKETKERVESIERNGMQIRNASDSDNMCEREISQELYDSDERDSLQKKNNVKPGNEKEISPDEILLRTNITTASDIDMDPVPLLVVRETLVDGQNSKRT